MELGFLSSEWVLALFVKRVLLFVRNYLIEGSVRQHKVGVCWHQIFIFWLLVGSVHFLLVLIKWNGALLTIIHHDILINDLLAVCIEERRLAVLGYHRLHIEAVHEILW